MKVKWLGHAAFLITSEDGTRIICDPYRVGEGVDYGPIDMAADIVTVSHKHYDHDNVAAVKGSPVVVDKPGKKSVKGIEFNGVPTFHDEARGQKRGDNIIFCFSVDGVRVCHLGDLGHELEKGQVNQIGSVDVLLVPVGGFYTIDAKQAARVCDQLAPKMVIPMHFKSGKCGFPIAGVEDFLKGRKKVERPCASEIEINKGRLPTESETVVLEHAL
jgi:L-ascorbate metabolism protein UlaG (beta-lactamase superfamily)